MPCWLRRAQNGWQRLSSRSCSGTTTTTSSGTTTTTTTTSSGTTTTTPPSSARLPEAVPVLHPQLQVLPQALPCAARGGRVGRAVGGAQGRLPQAGAQAKEQLQACERGGGGGVA